MNSDLIAFAALTFAYSTESVNGVPGKKVPGPRFTLLAPAGPAGHVRWPTAGPERINGFRSRIGRRPTAERPKVLDGQPGAAHAGPRGEDADPLCGLAPLWICGGLLHRRWPRLWTLPYGVSVIPSPRPGGMECGATTRSAGQSARGDDASPGVMTGTTRADREPR